MANKECSCTSSCNSAHNIEELCAKNDKLYYTLIGVMHFVDKWLDDIEPYCNVDDPDGDIAINRASDARELTLRYIEKIEKDRDKWKRRAKVAERDIAVACCTCKHEKEYQIHNVCKRTYKYDYPKCWEWRGPCEENLND